MPTRVLVPTKRGELIMKAIAKASPENTSIHFAAMRSGLHEATVRRWIYGEPNSCKKETADKFATIGVGRKLLAV